MEGINFDDESRIAGPAATAPSAPASSSSAAASTASVTSTGPGPLATTAPAGPTAATVPSLAFSRGRDHHCARPKFLRGNRETEFPVVRGDYSGFRLFVARTPQSARPSLEGTAATAADRLDDAEVRLRCG